MNAVGEVEVINGPIVQASGVANVEIAEVVFLGENRLVGEVISFKDEWMTIQVYESTSGLAPGAAVYSSGMPLSVELGPGLLCQIYDGIQRPLERIRDDIGPFIKGGVALGALDKKKQWDFEPCVKAGDNAPAGMCIGTVQETPLIQHRVLIPPGKGGKVVWIASRGKYTVTDKIATLQGAKGSEDISLMHRWPVRHPRPVSGRRFSTIPLVTGQRVIDTLFPIAKGGTAAIPGPFGSGKTVVQHQLAKWCDADIIVYVGCGERGNEMTEVIKEFPHLTDPKSKHPLLERTIMIANTSNMPVSAREASIYTGMTLAEYYRDQGYHVAVMADSTSRWAEALRELSGRLEEMPAESGFPAYLAGKLAAFYERAGSVVTLEGKEATLSIVGAVSPPGGDFTEPVTQYTKELVGTFWALSKELADSRHYPAIGWIKSFSTYADQIKVWWETNVDPHWSRNRNEAISLLQSDDRLQRIARLVGPETLPDDQRLIMATASLIKEGYLLQSALEEVDTYASPLKQTKLLELILKFNQLGKEIIALGCPIRKLTALPFYGALSRLKQEVNNDELKKIDEFAAAMTDQLAQLKEEYKRMKTEETQEVRA